MVTRIMTLTRDQKAKLPKSKLFWVDDWGPDEQYGGRRRRFIAFHRLANGAFLRVGRLRVNWRMPWLESSARALHPELFEESSS